jgi:hypothetical protein
VSLGASDWIVLNDEIAREEIVADLFQHLIERASDWNACPSGSSAM